MKTIIETLEDCIKEIPKGLNYIEQINAVGMASIKAMQQYASQESEREAKEFSEWLNKDTWLPHYDGRSFYRKYLNIPAEVKTIDELYQQFKSQKP